MALESGRRTQSCRVNRGWNLARATTATTRMTGGRKTSMDAKRASAKRARLKCVMDARYAPSVLSGLSSARSGEYGAEVPPARDVNCVRV